MTPSPDIAPESPKPSPALAGKASGRRRGNDRLRPGPAKHDPLTALAGLLGRLAALESAEQNTAAPSGKPRRSAP